VSAGWVGVDTRFVGIGNWRLMLALWWRRRVRGRSVLCRVFWVQSLGCLQPLRVTTQTAHLRSYGQETADNDGVSPIQRHTKPVLLVRIIAPTPLFYILLLTGASSRANRSHIHSLAFSAMLCGKACPTPSNSTSSNPTSRLGSCLSTSLNTFRKGPPAA
jgi:hypothetical protein